MFGFPGSQRAKSHRSLCGLPVSESKGRLLAPHNLREEAVSLEPVPENLEAAPANPAQPASARRRGWTKTAWVVIAAVVLVIIFLQRGGEPAAQTESLETVEQRVFELQGQYLVVAAQVPGVHQQQLYDSANALNSGPLWNRFRFVALAGELMGPEKAIESLDSIEALMAEHGVRGSASETQMLAVLRRLYRDYQREQWQAPSLDRAEKLELKHQLGWFGQLALAPKHSGGDERNTTGPTGEDEARQQVLRPAWRSFVLVIAAAMFALGIGVLGLGGVVIFAVFTLKRKLRSAMSLGSGLGGIYAETFAVWMIVFLALTIAGGFLAVMVPGHRIWISGAASLFSLGALAWPVLRGIPWRQVRREIGWYSDGKPIREMFWGVVCYVSNLPILLLGLLITVSLLALYTASAGEVAGPFDPVSSPAHPIIEWVRDAGGTGRLQIFLLASVVAPVVEETFFRGVLYRHLRESTCGWSTAGSVLFSAIFTSFVFAVIHPQGLLATPALMSVAAGLALTREWRGSLLASMTMHGTSNGLLMLLLFCLL